MGQKKARVRPLRLRGVGKTGVRTQFAALCFRVKKDEVQICLITSRGTGRWILPKGWPMDGETPAAAAATEAYEEAGLRGDPFDTCLGVYSYQKPDVVGPIPVVALVYPLRVRNVLTEWPEKGQRKRKWFPVKKAAKKLEEPALRHIVQTFDPASLTA